MGAKHILDLTTEVTHLIVGHSDTPKYRYVAKARDDIKVVHLGWIEAVREVWMNGGNVDLKKMEDEHWFPAFHSLHISITRYDDGTHFVDLRTCF